MSTTQSIVGGELYRDRVLRDGATGYWRLGDASGNALDSSGNARTLAVTGSPTYAQAGAIADGSQAVAFPGGALDCFTRNDAALRLTSVTLELSFKPSALPALQYLAGCGDTGYFGYRMTANAAGTLICSVGSGTAAVSVYGGAMVIGAWYHIIGTHDGGNVRLYLNSALLMTSAAAFPINYGAITTFGIAQLQTPTAARQAAGTLCDVSVNPSAITAQQVAAHYGLRLAAVHGGLKMGGTAPTARGRAFVGSGGLAMGGAAIVTRGVNTLGSGGMVIGGTAIPSRRVNVTPTGGITIGGVATIRRGVNVAPIGGMLMGGSAPARVGVHLVGSGGLILGGAGSPVGVHPEFIDVVGGYQPAIDVVGSYQPAIDVIGGV